MEALQRHQGQWCDRVMLHGRARLSEQMNDSKLFYITHCEELQHTRAYHDTL
jgi:hypothetical protein